MQSKYMEVEMGMIMHIQMQQMILKNIIHNQHSLMSLMIRKEMNTIGLSMIQIFFIHMQAMIFMKATHHRLLLN